MQHPTEGPRSLLTLKNYLEAALSMVLPYLSAETQVTRSNIISPRPAVLKKKWSRPHHICQVRKEGKSPSSRIFLSDICNNYTIPLCVPNCLSVVPGLNLGPCS